MTTEGVGFCVFVVRISGLVRFYPYQHGSQILQLLEINIVYVITIFKSLQIRLNAG